jgi:hypothetical protein
MAALIIFCSEAVGKVFSQTPRKLVQCYKVNRYENVLNTNQLTQVAGCRLGHYYIRVLARPEFPSLPNRQLYKKIQNTQTTEGKRDHEHPCSGTNDSSPAIF